MVSVHWLFYLPKSLSPLVPVPLPPSYFSGFIQSILLSFLPWWSLSWPPSVTSLSLFDDLYLNLQLVNCLFVIIYTWQASSLNTSHSHHKEVSSKVKKNQRVSTIIAWSSHMSHRFTLVTFSQPISQHLISCRSIEGMFFFQSTLELTNSSLEQSKTSLRSNSPTSKQVKVSLCDASILFTSFIIIYYTELNSSNSSVSFLRTRTISY